MKKHIKICPRCGSINIKSIPDVLDAVGVPPTLKCNECEYKGQLFPEIEPENIEKFKRDLKK